MTEDDDLLWSAWAPPGCRVQTLDGPGGRRFDLMLSVPEGEAPEGGWPCLMVLDGERFFGAVAGAAASLCRRTGKTGVTPMVVAAIAHRVDCGPVEDQRARDFTSTPCPEPDWTRPHGESATLRAFLQDTVIPLVAASAPIDRARLSLFGHSLAGLFVLETLEAAPDLFSRWVAISPSLWWRTPDPAIATADLMVGCGEAETARDMCGRIQRWADAGSTGLFRLAPEADHGSAPFALIPTALKHVSR